jgi:uncharacterized protein (TIGR00369 family)
MHDQFAKSNYSNAMGFTLERSGQGCAVVTCSIGEAHLNTRGFCHGGVISGLMDTAAGVATKSQLDDSQRTVATVSLTVNYQRAGQRGDTLHAKAQVLGGRRVVSCEIRVTNERDELIATGLATLRVG